jgi:hypothetical protein
MSRTVSNGLVLAGHDGEGDAWELTTPTGSMLAVYTLLEDHLGIRVPCGAEARAFLHIPG